MKMTKGEMAVVICALLVSCAPIMVQVQPCECTCPEQWGDYPAYPGGSLDYQCPEGKVWVCDGNMGCWCMPQDPEEWMKDYKNTIGYSTRLVPCAQGGGE